MVIFKGINVFLARKRYLLTGNRRSILVGNAIKVFLLQVKVTFIRLSTRIIFKRNKITFLGKF